MRFDKLLVFSVLIFLPFDATDYLSIQPGGVNVGAVDVVILMALIVVMLKQLATQASVKMTPDLLMLLLLAFGFSLVSLIWVLPSKLDLKISLNYLEYLGLFYVFAQVIREEAFLERLLRFFLLVVTCLAVLTILKSLGVNLSGLERHSTIPLWIFRIGVVGLEGQFAPFSLFLVGAIPLLWQKNLIKRWWLRIALNLLFVTAAAVTGARGLYVSLFAQVMAWLYFGYFNSLIGKKKILALVGLIIGIVIVAGLSIPLLELMEKMRPSTVDQRATNYLWALNLSTSDIGSFLFGYGKGNYVAITNMVAHNFLLDLLVSKGVLTLVCILALFSTIVYRLTSVVAGLRTSSGQMKTSLLLGFFGVVMVGQFDTITSSIVFWTYLAIIYAFTLIPRERATNFNFSRAYQVSRA